MTVEMSSFFLKSAPKKQGKRKLENPSKISKKSAKKESDEEIDSDEAVNSADDNDTNSNDDNYDNEEDYETAQDKRLRLAKAYLEEVEKEEQARAEDKELHDHVSKRLKNEYLDSIGKLRKTIADNYKGYNEQNLKYLKHKLQKLPVTCVLLSKDSKFMFTGSKTSFIVKWDLENYKVLGSFNCQDANENQENTIRTVNLNNHKNNKIKRRSHILSMCLSSDMKFLAIAEGGRDIQIWCPNELKLLKIFKGHRDTVTCLTFRKETHQLFSGSKDRSVKIWSLDEMTYVESLFGHQSPITGIDALYRERAITSGGMDTSIRIWKITEESQLIYNGHSGSIDDVKLINDENFLSCGDDGSLCIWSTLKKKPLCIQKLTHGLQENGEANWISAITTLINTDLIASGSCDGFIRIWKMCDNGRSLSELFKIPVKGFVNCLTFTTDGKFLIAAVSQEHRLGRWWRIKDAKNTIIVIEFDKLDSS